MNVSFAQKKMTQLRAAEVSYWLKPKSHSYLFCKALQLKTLTRHTERQTKAVASGNITFDPRMQEVDFGKFKKVADKFTKLQLIWLASEFFLKLPICCN